MSKHKWEFSARFRRHAFGWRSNVPMQRIKEALSEIRKEARKNPVIAAEGAIILLEKLSPALSHVDSSSGAIGSAVYYAIEALVPIIAKPVVATEVRQQWIERLWDALEDDNIPYIEHLEYFWGELCGTAEIASDWADKFIPVIKQMWERNSGCFEFFKGTIPCFSALFTAKRYDELLILLNKAPHKSWHFREWGIKALVALNKPNDALKYAEDSHGLNVSSIAISRACEEILLSMGMVEEAYREYALEANLTSTNLSTFRAITKKYPDKEPSVILKDLIASQPGSEGKWFAAAKNAGFFDLAIKLATQSPTDPHTLIRAAKEFSIKNPDFAIAAGMAGLHWIMLGYGYEVSSSDVLSAYGAIVDAAKVASYDENQIKANIHKLIDQPNGLFIKRILQRYLEQGV